MLTARQNEKPKNLEEDKREALNTLIGEQVIHALGKPQNLLKVGVRPLWENYYRVNVLIGADITSARIADSFFLTVDADGNIVTSTPQITKQYESR